MRRLAALACAGALGCAALAPVPASGPATVREVAAARDAGPHRASLDLVARALDELESGRASAARELADRALRLDGQNPYAYFALGLVALGEGAYPASRRDLEHARALLRDLEPDNRRWQGKFMRGEAELARRTGRAAEAAELERRARALDPGGTTPGLVTGNVIETWP